jgi:flavin-dependent dehydrogenase
MAHKKYDVIIIGGGPGGSTCGTYLAQSSLNVGLFERENYPRFHIGESLLPASMPIFKETGFYEKLSSGKYIEKYGARFIDYRNDDEIYFGFQDGLNRDIPMAFEVERSSFDRDILEHAREKGVHVHQPERVKDVEFFDSHVLVTTNLDKYEAQFLVDTSGRDAFLGKKNQSRQVNRDLNNVAVFSHFHGVKRNSGKSEGDIIIGLLPNRSWTWIIPFKGDKTSVGVVCSSDQFKGGVNLPEYLETRLFASPHVKEIMSNAERTTEVTVISNYSHRSETVVGDRWISAGDAAVFLDPIFSSGVHVSISTSKFAAETILKAIHQGCHLTQGGLDVEYQNRVNAGVKRFHSLISLFYEGDFVSQMKKTLTLKNMRQAFTSLVAGDVWDENNFLFTKGIIG